MPLGDSYARCVVVDVQGNKTVLYDNSASHSLTQIISIVAFSGFIVFVIWGSYQKLKQAEEC